MPKRKKKQVVEVKRGRWWMWLLVLGVLIVLIGGGGLWFRLRQGAIWDGQRRFTVALITEESGNGDPKELIGFKVRLLSLEPRIAGLGEKEAVVIDLPGEVKMHVVGGYGDYLVSALYGLAVQEGKMNLIGETLESELGVPVEGYVVSEVQEEKSMRAQGEEGDIKELAKEAEEWWKDRGVKSNLSWGDRVRLWWAMRKLGGDDVTWLDFSQGNWAREEQDVDGQTMIWFDKNAIDVRLPELMADSQLKALGLTVRVVNTTGIDGLGKQIARIIDSLGLRVVELTDESQEVERCVIRVENKERSEYAVRRLEGLFGCDLSKQELTDNRVEIELKAGRKEGQMWMGN